MAHEDEGAEAGKRYATQIKSAEAALDYILTARIKGEHRDDLVRACRARLQGIKHRARSAGMFVMKGKAWTEEDYNIIRETLSGVECKTRQESDAIIYSIAKKLRRTGGRVKMVVKDLGLGATIDWCRNS